MSGASTYLVHGLRVRSAVRLDAPVTPAGINDIEIGWGERRPVPDTIPDGHLLAHVSSPAGNWSLAAGPSGHLARVHGLCDFAVDKGRREVSVHLAPDAEPETASLLIGGLLATLLALDDRCVLHASAVETEGRVLAFIGSSGMGKTTLAALCCAAGASLVSDDALRVELRDGEGWCFTGTRELRLRPAAAELAGHLARSARRCTLDARTAVAPAAVQDGEWPLAAVIAPRPEPDTHELRIERLRGAEALVELLRFPRTTGWLDVRQTRGDFDLLAQLAAAVPVYRAHLPWGPPFDPQLARRLLERIGIPTPSGAA